tara:strand:- start:1325 stop:1507 length:183 start_codon:yes stop_codon:yes gene_type:complete
MTLKYEIQEFQYNENLSFQSNFETWFRLDTKEREDWNDTPLHIEDAYDKFVRYYGQFNVA